MIREKQMLRNPQKDSQFIKPSHFDNTILKDHKLLQHTYPTYLQKFYPIR
jgi:hypothetical protein